MANWQNASQAARPTIGKAVVALGLVSLLAESGQMECLLTGIFGATLRMALEALPSMALAAWQAFQGHGCEHFRLLDGLLQISASYWPVVLHLVAAA